MLWQAKFWIVAVLIIEVFGANFDTLVEAKTHRILLDTDVDTDDFFALLYLLKLNRSEFQLEVKTLHEHVGFPALDMLLSLVLGRIFCFL